MSSESATGLLTVCHVVRPATGGMRQHVLNLLRYRNRERFHPVLFAPVDFLPEGKSEIPSVALAIAARTNFLADRRQIAHLSVLLAERRGIVHAHGLRGALIGILASQRAHLASIFTVHNLLPSLGLLPRCVFRHIARRAKRVIAVSEAVAATLRAAGVPPEKIVVIPNGVDVAAFDRALDRQEVRARFGLAPLAPLVLAVGRLAPEKGFDVLIEAFRSVAAHDSEARLLLVGSGPQEETLRQQAGDSPSILFAGHQSDPIPLFLAADVIAIPSRSEGQGIVALEAMAARKPVIASRVGGLIETICEGETGRLVPSENAQEFANALTHLLRNPEIRERWGQAGRQRVEQKYEVRAMVDRVEAVYEAVWQEAGGK